ncbi:MAG: metallophosphoesterase [Bacteroidales bacterium]|nr:metallophosphoesterase [Bacteroidales bacterium]
MRIAILTDIHEDAVSLKKALRMIELEKCDQVVCLGDILGYPFMRARYEESRNAAECISLIRSNCSLVLTGNHDIFHLRKFPKHVNGFRFPQNWYELTPEEKTEAARGRVWNYSDDYEVKLSEKDEHYMASLPEYGIRETGEGRVLFSHYLYPNLTGYVSVNNGNEKALNGHFEFMRENDCETGICGHMHIEGLGVSYEPAGSILPRLFKGFMYYSYGQKRLKSRRCCVTVPALADNSQVNGFAIFDSGDFSINAVSLNTNRRFIL